MHVTFYKVDDGRLCSWTATTWKGKPFQGTTMASGSNLPHDLAQFVVEATLGFQEGFWGLLANGATFESVAGRRRTKPGRQLIRAHHDALVETEHLVNGHVRAWRAARSTPAGPALDAMLARWRTLPAGAALHLEWATQHLPRVKQDAPRRRLASRQRAAATSR
jgi:hypothetical protein